MHPTNWNSVQINPANEMEWKSLAKKCMPYPSGEKFDEVYWRTLMGNRIREPSGTSVTPTPKWHDAYLVWSELLSRNEGVLPRLRKGKVTKIREQIHPLALDIFRIKRPPPEKPPETLWSYFKDRDERTYRAQEKDIPSLLALRQRLDGIQSGNIEFRFSTAVNFATMNGPNPPPAKLPIEESDKPKIEEQPFADKEKGELGSATPNESAPFRSQEHQEKKKIDEVVEQQDLGENQATLKGPENNPSAKSESESESSRDASSISIDRVGRTFERDVLRMATNRQFAITEKRYMGWIPVDARKGDKICILMGGQVPFVLRPISGGGGGGEYQFIGEAYLHGLMDGEGMKMGRGWERVMLR